MKNRFFSLFVTVILLLTFGISISVNSTPYYTDYSQNGIIYTLYSLDNGLYVRGTDQTLTGDVVIPPTVQEIPVSSFVCLSGNGESRFSHISNITSLTLPNGLKEIAIDGAFQGLFSLKSIYIPASVTKVNDGIFRGGSANGQSFSSVFFIPNLTDIYYGGSESQWLSITDGKGIQYFNQGVDPFGRYANFSDMVTVHFNCSGIGNSSYVPPIQQNQISYNSSNCTLVAHTKDGKTIGRSTRNNIQGTGDIFYFTATTPVSVQKISLVADLFGGQEWHEIPYEHLVQHYKLTPQIVNNQKVWTCQFDLHNTGMRYIYLMADGVNTEVFTTISIVSNVSGTAYDFNAWNCDIVDDSDNDYGYANLNRVQWTGDVFYFYARTSQDVTEISILSDTPNGEWHEISFDYLTDYYHLNYMDYSDGSRVWTCYFGIHEAGFRTFKLKINGRDSGYKTYLTLYEHYNTKPRLSTPSLMPNISAHTGEVKSLWLKNIPNAESYVLWIWNNNSCFTIQASQNDGTIISLASSQPTTYSCSLYAVDADGMYEQSDPANFTITFTP